MGISLDTHRLFAPQVFLRSGQLVVYEIVSSPSPLDMPASRASSLKVKFVKVASRAFEVKRLGDTEKTVLAEQKRILRTFIPFVTTPPSGTTSFSGVFLTGDRPHWILATDKSGVNIIPSGHNIVHSFTTCSLWGSKGDFLLYTDEVNSSFLLSTPFSLSRSS